MRAQAQDDVRDGIATGELLFVLACVGAVIASALGGWIFAATVDPNGELLRWTLGWLVGEFR